MSNPNQMQVQDKQKEIKHSVEVSKKNDVDNFVNNLNPKKAEELADHFNESGKSILESIKNNIETKKNIQNITIDILWEKRIISKAQQIQTFKEANTAFKEDIEKIQIKLKKTEENKEKIEQMDGLLNIVNEINTLINGQAPITEAKKITEEEKTIYLQKNIETTKNGKEFFEGDEAIYNAILKDIIGKETKPLKINNTSKGNENSLYERVKKYTGIEKLWDIQVGKAKDFKWTENRFKSTEQVIAYENTQWEEKYIVRGNHEQVQNRIAENALNTGRIPEKIDRTTSYRKRIKDGALYTEKKDGEDGEEVKASLNMFDDIGNFQSFKKFLNHSEQKTDAHMREIITQIMNYTPSSDTADFKDYWPNFEVLKNGYANVLTEYMITKASDTELTIYLTYVTKNNLNLLWIDNTTRINNYNRLFFLNKEKGTLRPQIETYLKTLNEDQKKDFLTQIADLRNAITWNEKKTLAESFDSFIEAFWPMLFNILKFFGVSKAKLIDRFPEAEAKINEVFKKEYGLSKEALDAMGTISQKIKKTDLELLIKGNKDDDTIITGYNINKATAVYIKDNFTENVPYITELTNNVQHIHPSVFEQCVKRYNTDKNEKINMHDIVQIEKNNQGYNAIKKIKDGKSDEFKNILEYYLTTDTPWIQIATANKKIATKAKRNNKTESYNEHALNIGDARAHYCIKNNQDTARFLSAMFFSNKALDYTITENREKLQPKIYTTDKDVTLLDNKGEETENKIESWKEVIGWTNTIRTDLIKWDTNEYIRIKKWEKEWFVLKSDLTEKQSTEEIAKKNYEENNKKITEALTNIADDKYKSFDFKTFNYDKDAAGDQADYQKKLLTPTKDILTNEAQFKLLCADTNFAKKTKAIWPTHLKNTFLMMDNDITKQYTDLTNKIQDWAIITAEDNKIIITQNTWVITVGYENDKPTTKREVNKEITSSSTQVDTSAKSANESSTDTTDAKSQTTENIEEKWEKELKTNVVATIEEGEEEEEEATTPTITEQQETAQEITKNMKKATTETIEDTPILEIDNKITTTLAKNWITITPTQENSNTIEIDYDTKKANITLPTDENQNNIDTFSDVTNIDIEEKDWQNTLVITQKEDDSDKTTKIPFSKTEAKVTEKNQPQNEWTQTSEKKTGQVTEKPTTTPPITTNPKIAVKTAIPKTTPKTETSEKKPILSKEEVEWSKKTRKTWTNKNFKNVLFDTQWRWNKLRTLKGDKISRDKTEEIYPTIHNTVYTTGKYIYDPDDNTILVEITANWGKAKWYLHTSTLNSTSEYKPKLNINTIKKETTTTT